ncbi:MAG: cobalamin biosynthesis protein [Desulfovibrio sp.]|nr:cobalamin biosynthesis protein [Desulfovibrio sp.]
MELNLLSVWECWWLAPLAFALDMWLGDPKLPWPHPVRLVGRMLDALEPFARRLDGRGLGRMGGAACLVLCVLGTGGCALLLVQIPFAGPVIATYLSWAGLAQGSLLAAGRSCARTLASGDLEEGRVALSGLVSRDVSALDGPMLRKTLADTLSENYTDAFLAPYLWLLVAGPAGLWCYKAVSTADSMWGYLTPAWRDVGRAAARTDDVLAFLPARLGALALRATDALSRAIPGTRPWSGKWPGIGRIAKDAAGMPSPNSGWSMAACAWLCDAPMGGPSVYFGDLVEKPWLGPEGSPERWDQRRLLALLSLLFHGGMCGAAMTWLACMLLKMAAG